MKVGRSPFKNSHLVVSVILILPIALTYGLSPEKIVPALAGFKAGSTDIGNAFKALMGLYLGIVLFWALGIVKPQYWYAATLVNIFFTLGSVLGRVISLAVDGIPSKEMIVALCIELVLGLWGILSLRSYGKLVQDVSES
ncbi:MAG: DUF4345 domain-containing protein [Cytophagaceae bacterium]|nr:MAG: DUF4345 domain-containing protein [Cytophagaceae bacterium]